MLLSADPPILTHPTQRRRAVRRCGNRPPLPLIRRHGAADEKAFATAHPSIRKPDLWLVLEQEQETVLVDGDAQLAHQPEARHVGLIARLVIEDVAAARLATYMATDVARVSWRFRWVPLT